jgi:hypothetical protein
MKRKHKKSVSKKTNKDSSEGGLVSSTSNVKEEDNPTENTPEEETNPSLECFLCDADHTTGGMTSLLNHMSNTHYSCRTVHARKVQIP